MIELTVNGEVCKVAAPVTLAAYLEALGLRPRMIVVEHNREIVPRDRYAEVELRGGDTLEIVQMMAGG
jgi:thiamine biosynthesis protein ThiS